MIRKSKIEKSKVPSPLIPFLTIPLKELFAVLSIFILMNIVNSITQKATTNNNGQGWDGVYYYQLAQQISEHKRPEAPSPLVFRVGTSFLAAMADAHNLVRGFFIVNFIASLLIVVLLSLWLGCWIKDWKIRLLVSLIFQTNWICPVRFVWFYPVLTDYWPIVFILASLILAAKGRDLLKTSMGVALLSALGILFREFVFVVPLSYLFVGWRLNSPWKSLWTNFFLKILPLSVSVLIWYILRHSVSIVSDSYGFAKEAMICFSEPENLPMWFLSFLSVYGPALSAILVAPKTVFNFFKENLNLLAMLGAVLILSRLGGYDYERFMIWASPIVYLIIGVALDSKPKIFSFRWAIIVLLALQAFSQRLFWTIPADGGGDTPCFLAHLGNDASYLSLYSWYESSGMVHQRIIEYLSVFSFFMLAEIFLTFYNPKKGTSIKGPKLESDKIMLGRKKSTNRGGSLKKKRA